MKWTPNLVQVFKWDTVRKDLTTTSLCRNPDCFPVTALAQRLVHLAAAIKASEGVILAQDSTGLVRPSAFY